MILTALVNVTSDTLSKSHLFLWFYLAVPPAIFTVPPHGPFLFPATHFVDITEFEQTKVRLLGYHRSQEEAMRQAVEAGFEQLCHKPDAYWGEMAGCEYAECFTPLRGRGTIKPYPVLP